MTSERRGRSVQLRFVGAALAAVLLTAGCSGGDDGEPPEPTPTPTAEPTVLDPTPVPEITGDARNGETLTGHSGTWGPGDVTLSYRWLRDGEDITGAVDETYAITAADIGREVTLRVTGSKPGFEPVEQESEPVGPVLRAIMRSNQPTLAGDPVFGQRLTVGPLDWGSEEVRFRYQWLRDGVPVAGETRRGYVLGLSDLDRRVSVEVTGRLAGFDPATERSAPSAPVGTATLVASGRPQLTGVPRYFEFLTVPNPGWGPRPVALTYQWFRDGQPMEGITGTRYQLRGRDIGHRVKVEVVGTKAGYATRRQFTTTVGPVKEGRLNPTPRPTLAGVPEVDQYLTAAIGPWGPAPATLSWQWFRGDRRIKGAIDTSYRLTVADLGERISVGVVGEAQYFEPTTRVSDRTQQVQPGQLTRTPTPLYSGTAQVGETVTALPKEWGPGAVRLAYQWFREGRKIDGATDVQYVARPADEGKRLRVRVTGTREGYRPASQLSGFTSRVAPGVLTPGVPGVVGLALDGQTLEADGGDWGPGQVDLRFQWLRDGLPIDGAAGSSYLLVPEDVGATISVQVTGRRPGYATAEAWSPPTEPVLARER